MGSSNGIVSNNEVYNQKAQRYPPGIYIDAGYNHEFNIDVFDNISHDNGAGFGVGSEDEGLTEGISRGLFISINVIFPKFSYF